MNKLTQIEVLLFNDVNPVFEMQQNLTARHNSSHSLLPCESKSQVVFDSIILSFDFLTVSFRVYVTKANYSELVFNFFSITLANTKPDFLEKIYEEFF